AAAYHTIDPTPSMKSSVRKFGAGPGRRGNARRMAPAGIPKSGGVAYNPKATAATAMPPHTSVGVSQLSFVRANRGIVIGWKGDYFRAAKDASSESSSIAEGVLMIVAPNATLAAAIPPITVSKPGNDDVGSAAPTTNPASR